MPIFRYVAPHVKYYDRFWKATNDFLLSSIDTFTLSSTVYVIYAIFIDFWLNRKGRSSSFSARGREKSNFIEDAERQLPIL